MGSEDARSFADRIRRLPGQSRFRRAAAVCLAAVVLLTLVSYAYRRPVMERAIARSVGEALRVDGHAGIEIDVEGRDVALRGVVGDAAERQSVIRLAQKRNGVRVVDASGLRTTAGATDPDGTPTDATDPDADPDATDPNDTDPNDTTADPDGTADGSDAVTASTVATIQVRKPRIDATFRDGVLVVTGNAPTKEAAAALVYRSSTVLEPPQIVDQLVVPAEVTELADMNEYRRLGDFLALLPRAGLQEATLRYDRGKLNLAGVLVAETDRAFLEREAENLVGAAQVTIELEGPPADTTVLSATPSVPASALTAGAVAAQGRIDTAVAARTIGFAKASDVLSDDGRIVVDDVAAAIAALANPALVIQVVGYTDDRGSEGGNLDLSQRRADAVREALVAKGIDGTRISALGKGEADPIAPNDTEEDRAKNRRIEIKVVSG